MALWIALVLGLASASEEQIAPWSEITISTDFIAPYAESKVTLKTEGGALTRVTVKPASTAEVVVPKEALKGLTAVQLQSVQLTSEMGYDPVPWLYIKISYGAAIPGTTKVYRQAVFAVQGDRVVYRALLTPHGDGYKHEQQDL